jgi:nucleoside-diphosphate-sugar epimerase
MNCLITGNDGFLAKNLINFLKKKYDVFSISRKRINKNKTKVLFLNLSKRNCLKKIKIKKIDYIIHVASIMMTKKMSEEKIVSQNLNIINNLINLIKLISFKKIINISSISLYPSKDGNYRESSQVNFLNNTDYPYAFSKYVSEKKIDTNFPKKKILHLRVAQIIGNKKDSSIISSLKKEIKKKNSISVFGNGERILNLIHISKLLIYIDLSIKKNLYGVFNVSDYSINLQNIAKILKNKYGNFKTKILFDKKINRNEKFKINNKKFLKRLNIKLATKKDLINEI